MKGESIRDKKSQSSVDRGKFWEGDSCHTAIHGYCEWGRFFKDNKIFNTVSLHGMTIAATQASSRSHQQITMNVNMTNGERFVTICTVFLQESLAFFTDPVSQWSYFSLWWMMISPTTVSHTKKKLIYFSKNAADVFREIDLTLYSPKYLEWNLA